MAGKAANMVCHIVEPCDRLLREQEGVSNPVGTEGLSIPFVRDLLCKGGDAWAGTLRW